MAEWIDIKPKCKQISTYRIKFVLVSLLSYGPSFFGSPVWWDVIENRSYRVGRLVYFEGLDPSWLRTNISSN